MKVFESKRLLYSTWDESDAEQAFRFYGDPEVSKYIGKGTPSSNIDSVKKMIQKLKKHHDEFGYMPWAIINKKSDKIVGISGLHNFNEEKQPELGFRILRSEWGKGLATEASKACINFGFNHLRMNNIVARTHLKNHATVRVLEKSGFHLVKEEYLKEIEQNVYLYKISRQNLNNLKIQQASLLDVKNSARLHSCDDQSKFNEYIKVFENEFKKCEEIPDKHTYFLAYDSNNLVSFAGARHYEDSQDEEMYKTIKSLPSGWYLRGLRVHNNWQRRGLARMITKRRLKWLSSRTNQCFVFLSSEQKETIPMYKNLGFVEKSRGWKFKDIKIQKKGVLLSYEF